jgi:hypothetical protein
MSRPHIEFVQSQRLPWHSVNDGPRAGTRHRELSRDAVSGACSRVIQYPPGWSAAAGQCLAADEEFLVLDGELRIGGLAYSHHCYAHLPAGYLRGALSAPAGAIVLTFFSAAPVATPPTASSAQRGAAADPRLVERLDCYTIPWEPIGYAQMRTGTLRKPLRLDPVNGDTTWLLTSPPHGMPPGGAGARETHPTVEEVFVLAGDLHGNCGVMRAGAYFWRPAGILHGPYGSRLGATSLYRTVGGPLVAEWTTERFPFRYDPPYEPALPAGFELLPEPPEPGARPW